MLCSGARWTELGDRPFKYFLGMCAKKRAKKDIHVLETAEGRLVHMGVGD